MSDAPDPLLGRNDRVLVIDDNPAIHADFQKILCPRTSSFSELAAAEHALLGESLHQMEPVRFRVETALQGHEGLERVRQALEAKQPFALAFVDIRMPPGWDGIETISRMWQVDSEIQIVICTAYSDYSWDEIIHRLGHSDSLLILKKPFDNIEVLQLAHALTRKWSLNQQAKLKVSDLESMVEQRTVQLRTANDRLRDEISERIQAEAALRISEERFSRAFRASPMAMAILSLEDERFIDVNERFIDLIGCPREALVRSAPPELQLWIEPNARKDALARLRRSRSVPNFPCKVRTASGELRDALVSLELLDLEHKPHVLAITQDISDRLRLENQLRQAQKMEAVGTLAAGIAHDFNNILTIIQGYASFTLSSQRVDAPVRESLEQVMSAAERAAKLTYQLLAFSRQQLMQLKAVDVNALVNDLTNMLSRLIGEQIRLAVRLGTNVPTILADAGNVEQVLINLVLNARDAMPSGGELTIRTESIHIDEKHVKENPEAIPGQFVCLTVVDTGCGIAPELRTRIFEPFFTTKESGRGTGMGLAMAYGIVRQHQGWIEVLSAPQKGATFRVFFPVRPSREPGYSPISRGLPAGTPPLGSG